jgi:hypothetical protein
LPAQCIGCGHEHQNHSKSNGYNVTTKISGISGFDILIHRGYPGSVQLNFMIFSSYQPHRSFRHHRIYAIAEILCPHLLLESDQSLIHPTKYEWKLECSTIINVIYFHVDQLVVVLQV